jgi:hypothetical protein
MKKLIILGSLAVLVLIVGLFGLGYGAYQLATVGWSQLGQLPKMESVANIIPSECREKGKALFRFEILSGGPNLADIQKFHQDCGQPVINRAMIKLRSLIGQGGENDQNSI